MSIKPNVPYPVQWCLRDVSDLQSKSCSEESLHEIGLMRIVARHLHVPQKALKTKKIPSVDKNSIHIPMYNMLPEVESLFIVFL